MRVIKNKEGFKKNSLKGLLVGVIAGFLSRPISPILCVLVCENMLSMYLLKNNFRNYYCNSCHPLPNFDYPVPNFNHPLPEFSVVLHLDAQLLSVLLRDLLPLI